MCRTMKKSLVSAYASAILAAGAVGASAPASAAANCEDLLNNNVYSCNVIAGDGFAFSDTFTFVSPGTQSDHFDLLVEGLSDFPLGCACKAKGSFSNPAKVQFDASKDFHCVSSADFVIEDGGFGIAFEGKVVGNGKKIKKGQAVDEFGFSYVYECELLDVAVGGTAASSGASPWRRGRE